MERTVKRSKQRDYLVELLKSTKTHPDANWIFWEMKKRFDNISLATVYRNLKFLADAGEIVKIDIGDSSEHYDIDTELHYHFVCEKCDRIDDIAMPVLDNVESDLNNELNVIVKRHALTFYGICADCTENAAR